MNKNILMYITLVLCVFSLDAQSEEKRKSMFTELKKATENNQGFSSLSTSRQRPNEMDEFLILLDESGLTYAEFETRARPLDPKHPPCGSDIDKLCKGKTRINAGECLFRFIKQASPNCRTYFGFNGGPNVRQMGRGGTDKL